MFAGIAEDCLHQIGSAIGNFGLAGIVRGGGPGTGWSPAPIILRDEVGDICGALPAYLKSHSQGEYVFDHSWADAYERAAGRYYPKLQIAAPFSPVPGPRVLVRDDETALRLLRAAESVVLQNGLSSAHATFVEEAQLDLFRKAGWLIRSGTQFHWANGGYSSFDDFMATLASRKRRAIRKERAAAQSAVDIQILRDQHQAAPLRGKDTFFFAAAIADLAGHQLAVDKRHLPRNIE